MEITKVRQLERFALMVLIRKELQNLLVISGPLLTNVPSSQYGGARGVVVIMEVPVV